MAQKVMQGEGEEGEEVKFEKTLSKRIILDSDEEDNGKKKKRKT